MSYSKFEVAGAQVAGDIGEEVVVNVTVTNVGSRRGVHVVEVFSSYEGDHEEMARDFRFVGCAKVELDVGESCPVTISLSPRRFSSWISGAWNIPEGDFAIHLGRSAGDLAEIGRISA